MRRFQIGFGFCVSVKEIGLGSGATVYWGHLVTEHIVPVVLSGGGGTRLWPLSTDERPKQFLNLVGKRSLFAATLARTAGIKGFARPLVITNLRHAQLCEEELAFLHDGAVIMMEPVARNTAPAIIMGAIEIERSHGADSLMLVMPSDHVIMENAEFLAAVQKAVLVAQQGYLVTFGIRPTRVETGFGYLKLGAPISHADGAFEVGEFVEKPPYDDAEAMIASGNYSWNSGIFLFRVKDVLTEARIHAPSILENSVKAVQAAVRDGRTIVLDAPSMLHCPSQSIDYAIMEKAERVAVVPMAPGWSDVGSWDAMAELEHNESMGDVGSFIDCSDLYVRSDGIQVSGIGLKGLIIVASGNQVLIVSKGRSQEVKNLILSSEK